MSGAPKLAWSRPITVVSPQIWRIFSARDLTTDDMVVYRIQDLPVERIEDAIQFMLNNYLKADPIIQAFGGSASADHAADYAMIWRAAFEQNTALACISYSGEIIGVNVNYVITKNETFLKDIRNSCKSPLTRDVLDTTALLYQDFDVFERYGVDRYLASFGLSVAPKFRGRGIGRQLLLARKEFCESLEIPLTHTIFPSDNSNRLADRGGFKPDVALTYKEVSKLKPKLKFLNIGSDTIECKTLVFTK